MLMGVGRGMIHHYMCEYVAYMNRTPVEECHSQYMPQKEAKICSILFRTTDSLVQMTTV